MIAHTCMLWISVFYCTFSIAMLRGPPLRCRRDDKIWKQKNLNQNNQDFHAYNRFVTWILPFKRFRVRMTVSRKVGYLVLVRLEPMQSIQVYWFGLSSGMVKPHLPCKIQIFLFKCQNYTKTEMLHYHYLHIFILKKILLG